MCQSHRLGCVSDPFEFLLNVPLKCQTWLPAPFSRVEPCGQTIWGLDLLATAHKWFTNHVTTTGPPVSTSTIYCILKHLTSFLQRRGREAVGRRQESFLFEYSVFLHMCKEQGRATQLERPRNFQDRVWLLLAFLSSCSKAV